MFESKSASETERAQLCAVTFPVHNPARDMEAQIVAAQPRLRRIARTAGIPLAHQEDVVQDTLLAAWHYQHQVRQPERFDAWLDAICRNQCRLFWRANAARAHEEITFLDGLALNQSEAEEIADPQAQDPLDELDQRETSDFIARALTHLTPAARHLLSLRYLADLPEREVAELLKVSIPVLEARLHRARRQLRAVMEGPLHDESTIAGLLPLGDEEIGWHETAQWCNLCGKRHLVGRFDGAASNMPGLRLRCPACSPALGLDIYYVPGVYESSGKKAFRPALNRSMREQSELTYQRIATGVEQCPFCGGVGRAGIAGPEEMPEPFPQLQRFWSVAACACVASQGIGFAWTVMEAVLWVHPAAQRFMRAHPRWLSLPESAVEWQGRPALRFHLADAASAARFVAFADARTLEVLDTFEE